MMEKPETEFRAVVTKIASLVAQASGKPFHFFGHSMGALIAYEVARQLEATVGLSCEQLHLSACRPPESWKQSPRVSEATDAELIERLRRYNGTSEEVLGDPELLSIVLPIYRADYRLIESYSPSVDAVPLGCALTVFGGEQDPDVSSEHLSEWSRATKGPFRKIIFGGDHFYLLQNLDGMAAELNASFRTSERAGRILTISS